MTHPRLALALCAVAVLFAAGCNNADGPPRPNLTQNKATAPGSKASPAVTVPDMPDPNVPKAAQAPSPKPGQANDHSSPAFKAGGPPDPSK